jgi:hypothetical protein
MTTIAESIAARVSRAETAARAAQTVHETARMAALGPFPVSRSDRQAWSDYLDREHALSAELRAELTRLGDAERDAESLATALRGDDARTSLADRTERDCLCHLPRWAVAQTERARLVVIAPPLRSAIARWQPPANLLLLGPTGTGKTTAAAHLILTMLGRWLDADCTGELVDVHWIQSTRLERARREHGLGQGESLPLVTARDCGLLVIDDLGQEPSRGETCIWDVIDRRYSDCLPTIITSGLTRGDLASRYGAAFVRRLNQDGTAVVGEAFG